MRISFFGVDAPLAIDKFSTYNAECVLSHLIQIASIFRSLHTIKFMVHDKAKTHYLFDIDKYNPLHNELTNIRKYKMQSGHFSLNYLSFPEHHGIFSLDSKKRERYTSKQVQEVQILETASGGNVKNVSTLTLLNSTNMVPVNELASNFDLSESEFRKNYIVIQNNKPKTKTNNIQINLPNTSNVAASSSSVSEVVSTNASRSSRLQDPSKDVEESIVTDDDQLEISDAFLDSLIASYSQGSDSLPDLVADNSVLFPEGKLKEIKKQY